MRHLPVITVPRTSWCEFEALGVMQYVFVGLLVSNSTRKWLQGPKNRLSLIQQVPQGAVEGVGTICLHRLSQLISSLNFSPLEGGTECQQ